jgi:hypothetical protein
MDNLTPEEVRLIANREYRLLQGVLIFFGVALGVGLLHVSLQYEGTHPLAIAVAWGGSLWLTVLFYQFLAAAKFKAPWAYTLGFLILGRLVPILGWLLLAFAVMTVNKKVFSPRGVRVGLLGPILKS